VYLHPGMINSGASDHFWGPVKVLMKYVVMPIFALTVDEGAANVTEALKKHHPSKQASFDLLVISFLVAEGFFLLFFHHL